MRDDLAEALIAELRQLNKSVSGLQSEVRRAAAIVAAGSLVAVDAARSEVFAHLMDESLVELADRLATSLGAPRDK